MEPRSIWRGDIIRPFILVSKIIIVTFVKNQVILSDTRGRLMKLPNIECDFSLNLPQFDMGL